MYWSKCGQNSEFRVLIEVWTEQWILVHAGGYVKSAFTNSTGETNTNILVKPDIKFDYVKSAFTNSSGETNTNILVKPDIKFDSIHSHLVSVSFLR